MLASRTMQELRRRRPARKARMISCGRSRTQLSTGLRAPSILVGVLALAVANAKTLVDHGVAAVIGPVRSAQVLKAQAMTYPAKVLHLTPTAGASALASSQPATDRYLFQTITSIRGGSASAIVRYATTPRA